MIRLISGSAVRMERLAKAICASLHRYPRDITYIYLSKSNGDHYATQDRNTGLRAAIGILLNHSKETVTSEQGTERGAQGTDQAGTSIQWPGDAATPDHPGA